MHSHTETCLKFSQPRGECYGHLGQYQHSFYNNFDIFSFSKQKNFLLVGTADGNLAIFEDKTVKVNVESILHQKIF